MSQIRVKLSGKLCKQSENKRACSSKHPSQTNMYTPRPIFQVSFMVYKHRLHTKLRNLHRLVMTVIAAIATRNYSKTFRKRPLKKKTKLVFKTDYRLMQVKSIAECSPLQVKSIAECSKGSILQYF